MNTKPRPKPTQQSVFVLATAGLLNTKPRPKPNPDCNPNPNSDINPDSNPNPNPDPNPNPNPIDDPNPNPSPKSLQVTASLILHVPIATCSHCGKP